MMIAPRRAMVASMGIEYLAQGYFHDPVDVRCAIEGVGRTSFTIIQLMSQGGRNVARHFAALTTNLCIVTVFLLTDTKNPVPAVG